VAPARLGYFSGYKLNIYFIIFKILMGDSQSQAATKPQGANLVLAPQNTVVPPAPTVNREIPPPIAPVNGPVQVATPADVPVNINIDPRTKQEVRVNGLMPEAMRTKEILDTKPKVSLWLPLDRGEKVGIATEFVSINGYPYWVKKGVMVLVPQPVAELLMNMYNIAMGDSAFGHSMRADRNKVLDGESIQNALNG